MGSRPASPALTLDVTIVTRYVANVIKTFRDRQTAAAFQGLRLKGFPPDLVRRAQKKLRQLDAARTLQDLHLPPSNRLKALERERKGQHSIRINDQWRICFVWRGADAYDVEITDYH
jgi:toxin HigB-1